MANATAATTSILGIFRPPFCCANGLLSRLFSLPLAIVSVFRLLPSLLCGGVSPHKSGNPAWCSHAAETGLPHRRFKERGGTTPTRRWRTKRSASATNGGYSYASPPYCLFFLQYHNLWGLTNTIVAAAGSRLRSTRTGNSDSAALTRPSAGRQDAQTGVVGTVVGWSEHARWL